MAVTAPSELLLLFGCLTTLGRGEIAVLAGSVNEARNESVQTAHVGTQSNLQLVFLFFFFKNGEDRS